jgi:hypothetical protein
MFEEQQVLAVLARCVCGEKAIIKFVEDGKGVAQANRAMKKLFRKTTSTLLSSLKV